MKMTRSRLLGFSAIVLFAFLLKAVPAFSHQKEDISHNRPWYDNKYSMFIHFGLYSQLGGVWQGEEIHYGYSEQIMAHAGIYANVYQDEASRFDPINFNADSIVALAKRAGMRSIVITSKHHDGFCMFRTSTTDFNSYDATPAHRDYIGELSEACHRGGINFGLYYSLIDWNYTGASNITTHNANFIPEIHHQLNLRQVEELVTNYGTISELWFDMGSLTYAQSRELYELVHRNQPDCMVSGRLGNGCYDFAVMSDNYYPESSLQIAWQSCASMFNETWGYRSWQKRGDVHTKAQEKLRSLIRVTTGGGNFLLNIGPMGDGSVVPFEKQVLEEIGSWLQKNGDVIYATDSSPYRQPFSWGGITRKGPQINLILSGEEPSDGVISLPLMGKIVKVSGPAKAQMRNGTLKVTLDPDAYSDEIQVIRITLDRDVTLEEEQLLDTRIASSSYYCQDYYTNHRSEISYKWNLSSKNDITRLGFSYASTDIGKEVLLNLDGTEKKFVLDGSGKESISKGNITESPRYVCQTSTGGFDASKNIAFSLDAIPDNDAQAKWVVSESAHQKLTCKPFQTIYVLENLHSDCDQEAIIEVGAGNGMELYVNGESVIKHMNPYRCTYRMEKVRVQLHKGDNQLVLRAYNRFEKSLEWHLGLSEEQCVYWSKPVLEADKSVKRHTLSVTQTGLESKHKDCELYNLQLRLKK